MSFRSVEFSAVLIFAVCTALMTYLTYGKERERAMLFPDYYFFAKRRLVNHTIDEKYVKNLDDCELLCYLNDNCVSANFKKDPEKNSQNAVLGHLCELNNATHLKYDRDLITDTDYYYRGSKNACDKSSRCENNATCQSGFTHKGYKCLCPSGFNGELCEKDIDECTIKTDICHQNASCSNTPGSFNCICRSGYIGNGLHCEVDPCHHYTNLSDTNRKDTYVTSNSPVLCEDIPPEKWYRFVGDAGTKMPTKRVQAYRCGTAWSGWLNGAHPTVEDDEVTRTVCFSDRSISKKVCNNEKQISVKNCGSYFIYKLQRPNVCDSRYCGTD